uniref:BLOC-1-related complex subunit 6 C-terminal helix domain-containing protein n=1 Tax=Aplanochytrium stocchinoi TaxID=215587 RepID=A0A7S3LNP3_9STRA|mmetsp:Transcript_2673/g.3474  ORF Transcript_2673/g.3474 Transcript_2673/m.3474 type:complete len:182 (+) Transcript_2673:222-767(+)
MLKLPESESDSTNTPRQSPEPAISFGFDSAGPDNKDADDDKNDEKEKHVATQAESGLDKSEADQTLLEVKKKASHVALEISGLVSSLKTTVQDACELTRAHAQVQKQVCDEVELIVETGVKCSEQLLTKVLNLSSRLDNLDEMKRNVDRIDTALLRYEKVADSLIERRRRTRAHQQQRQKA